jgi:hypothetical protein
LVKTGADQYQEVADPESPESPAKRFKLVNHGIQEQLEREATKAFVAPFRLSPTPPPPEPRFKAGPDLSDVLDTEEDDPLPHIPEFLEHMNDETPSSTDLLSQQQVSTFDDGEYPQTQLPTFKMPSDLEDVLNNCHTQLDGDFEVSFVSTISGFDDSSHEILPPPPKPTPKALCPMCREPVEAEFLKNYNSGNQMNIRTQAKFCRAHKKRSARTEWTSRGYPTIDWDSLDARIAEHHSFLKNILDTSSSYYRDILEENVKSGKDKTLFQAIINSDISLTPGYYGSRGLRAMSENIMHEFTPQLRKLAVTDRLVSARGVSNYVQTVLVPELCVKLVQEDMHVEVQDARRIMSESVGLGDLLNDEIKDVVILKEGDS